MEPLQRQPPAPSRPGPRSLSAGLATLLTGSPRRAAASAAEPRAAPPVVTPRAFTCRCGRPVFFGNTECLACHAPLGYDPELGRLLPLAPVPQRAPAADESTAVPLWRAFDAPVGAPGATTGVSPARGRYRRCGNLGSDAACNWLVAEDDAGAGPQGLCRSCRLTRTVPDLTRPDAGLWWGRIEAAKRRLASQLIGLRLPWRSKAEDPGRGLVFDLLLAAPGGPAVTTGHVDGVITIDAAEADDAERERRRIVLGEPYRTLLGHLRHESGHYYWQRLVRDDAGMLDAWRRVFGDEEADYAAALARHHDSGAPADWPERFVSGYASCHPWEDWAETWAHYLHLADTLDTARSFGLDGERVALSYERFGPEALAPSEGGRTPPPDATAAEFLARLNGWMELTGVLNELSRAMGVADFYPFVLTAAVVRKLHFVHRVIAAHAAGRQEDQTP